MSDWVVTIVVALIAASPGMWSLVKVWRSSDADVAKQYEEMASKQAKQIGELRITVHAQGTRIQQLEDTMKEWRAGISILCNQIVAGGGTPHWQPKEPDSDE